jgi:endonuclease YncB( thermonuclease family)
VIRVCSGDEIEVQGQDSVLKVRFAGIRIPRTRQAAVEKARKYLGNLIFDRIVEIRNCGCLDHGWILGEVIMDGRNLNLELLETGMAEVDREQFSEEMNLSAYLNAEQEARRANKGIWSGRDKVESLLAILLYCLRTQKWR